MILHFAYNTQVLPEILLTGVIFAIFFLCFHRIFLDLLQNVFLAVHPQMRSAPPIT